MKASKYLVKVIVENQMMHSINVFAVDIESALKTALYIINTRPIVYIPLPNDIELIAVKK